MTEKRFLPDGVNYGTIKMPEPYITIIYIGNHTGRAIEVGVDKKFNWFQKKMIKWCFGFEVKENK
jgi:hypothetical protein